MVTQSSYFSLVKIFTFISENVPLKSIHPDIEYLAIILAETFSFFYSTRVSEFAPYSEKEESLFQSIHICYTLELALKRERHAIRNIKLFPEDISRAFIYQFSEAAGYISVICAPPPLPQSCRNLSQCKISEFKTESNRCSNSPYSKLFARIIVSNSKVSDCLWQNILNGIREMVLKSSVTWLLTSSMELGGDIKITTLEVPHRKKMSSHILATWGPL